MSLLAHKVQVLACIAVGWVKLEGTLIVEYGVRVVAHAIVGVAYVVEQVARCAMVFYLVEITLQRLLIMLALISTVGKCHVVVGSCSNHRQAASDDENA